MWPKLSKGIPWFHSGDTHLNKLLISSEKTDCNILNLASEINSTHLTAVLSAEASCIPYVSRGSFT